MLIDGTTVRALQPLASIQAAAGPVTATAAPAASSTGPKPLFANGLVNYASLMTPDTLRAIYELNADRTVKTDQERTPQMAATHHGPYNAGESLLALHVRAQANAASGVGANLASAVTDKQKQFFHDTTGYNLVVDGALMGVYDDSGRLVSNGADPKTGGAGNALWQLAFRLDVNEGPAGKNESPLGKHATIDAAWFENFMADMKSARIPVPASWAANAQKYFDSAPQATKEQPKAAAVEVKALVGISA